MQYRNIKEALFLQRPNRFIAHVMLDEQEVVCHVKNTGRCKELLIPGKTRVYIEDHGINNKRKTRYSLVTVRKGDRLVNMDSQAPNEIACEWILRGDFKDNITFLKREVKYGDSRFDIYYEREENQKKIKGFMEVKGVTLEDDNVVRFPDAPTERGIKHIEHLISAAKEGYEANILFVVQMENVKYFEPDYDRHREFAETLKKAAKSGVNVIAVDCHVTEDTVTAKKPVEVVL